jgi:hypothetical protein
VQCDSCCGLFSSFFFFFFFLRIAEEAAVAVERPAMVHVNDTVLATLTGVSFPVSDAVLGEAAALVGDAADDELAVRRLAAWRGGDATGFLAVTGAGSTNMHSLRMTPNIATYVERRPGGGAGRGGSLQFVTIYFFFARKTLELRISD